MTDSKSNEFGHEFNQIIFPDIKNTNITFISAKIAALNWVEKHSKLIKLQHIIAYIGKVKNRTLNMVIPSSTVLKTQEGEYALSQLYKLHQREMFAHEIDGKLVTKVTI